MMKKIAFVSLMLTASLNAYFYDGVPVQNNCCGRGSFGVGAEWLYWKSFLEDMDFAFLNNVTVDETTEDVTVDATILSPRFKRESGFRVFVDYASCNNEWDLAAIYTHHSSRARRSESVDPSLTTSFISLNNTTFPIFNILNNALVSSVDTDWRSNFNYFDLDLSRNFSFCDRFRIIPHLGLRGLWMTQRFDLNAVSATETPLLITSEWRDRFNGYGVEGGFRGAFQIGCGFSLLGDIGGSILYGNIKTREQINVADDGEFTIMVMRQDESHARPTFDTFVGLEYANQFCNFPWEIHAGWEQHVLFHVNHFGLLRYFTYTLQGLTLGGSVRF